MNTVPPPPPASSTNEPDWFYASPEGGTIGPVHLYELKRLASEGIITDETFVIRKGSTDWRRYGDLSKGTGSIHPAMAQNPPRRWPTILCLLFLYPIGLILLWLGNAFSTKAKIVLTISFGIFFLFAMNRETEPRTTQVSSESDVEEYASEPKPKKSRSSSKVKTARAGESFRLGDFTYRFISDDVTSEVGSRFSRVRAQDDALFLIVTYSITNDSNETETVLTDDVTFKDEAGRIFRSSSRLNTALMMEREDKDFILSELQPGLTKTMVTGFELPSSAFRGKWTLVVKEKGFFGTGTVEVLFREFE